MAARALCRLRRAAPSLAVACIPSPALPAWRALTPPEAEQDASGGGRGTTGWGPSAAEMTWRDQCTDASPSGHSPLLPSHFLTQAEAPPAHFGDSTRLDPHHGTHAERCWGHQGHTASFAAGVPPLCTSHSLQTRTWLHAGAAAGSLMIPCSGWEPSFNCGRLRVVSQACTDAMCQAGMVASALGQPVRRHSSHPSSADHRERSEAEGPGRALSPHETSPNSAPNHEPNSTPNSTPDSTSEPSASFGAGGGQRAASEQERGSFPHVQKGEGRLEGPTASWIPASLLPYYELARLDKPIGTWLLAWPCFWSIALATPPGALPDVALVALFGVGALLMRGAGCTINDILDRDIDAQVERTRLRPLARGALSVKAAVGFLGVQLCVALGVLLQLNTFSRVLGAASLPLVLTYPLMKRVTDWPQAYLGLAFNWGALLGWAAVRGSLDLPVVLPLYAGGVFWTLVYDTIYAHQDKEDDAIVGVRSTARLFGDNSRLYLSGFGVATLASLTAAGLNAGLGTPFLLAMAAPSAHLGWQVLGTNFNNGNDCLLKFRSNREFGALVLGAILAGKYLL